jgi:hypothetical protein
MLRIKFGLLDYLRVCEPFIANQVYINIFHRFGEFTLIVCDGECSYTRFGVCGFGPVVEEIRLSVLVLVVGNWLQ